jgi:hypothetical protein
MNYLDQFQIEKEWQEYSKKIQEHFGKSLSLEGVLLFIGLRELGSANTDLDKDTKERLIDIGMCTVLAQSSYFVLVGKDESGFPVYQVQASIPKMSVKEQETLLKQHIVGYLKSIDF